MADQEKTPIHHSVPPKSDDLMKLMEDILQHMEVQNKSTRDVIKTQRQMGSFQKQSANRLLWVAVLALLAVCLGMFVSINTGIAVDRLETTEHKLSKLQVQLREAIDVAKAAHKEATQTQKNVEALEGEIKTDSPKLIADRTTGELQLELPVTEDDRVESKQDKTRVPVVESAAKKNPKPASVSTVKRKARIALPAPQGVEFRK